MTSVSAEGPAKSLPPDEMAAVILRLKRAQGQIGGIIAMIEQDRECRDIVTQVAAVSKALDRAGFAIIASGLRQCFTGDGESADTLDVKEMERLFLSLA